MPANMPIFGIIPNHFVLINVNEKNILNKNPAKEKECNSISMNLQVKVVHVLAKKSVKYNVREVFHHLYSSKLCYSGFYTISKNISNVFHSRVFVELFFWSFGNDRICKASSFSLLITSHNFLCKKVQINIKMIW